MEMISEDSIELEELHLDAESEQVTRQSYRLPINKSDANYLEVGEERFPLLDISAGGICVAVQADTIFPHDATLTGCRLVLGAKRFEDMDGEIAHISVDDEGNWISGIQWTMVSDDTYTELEAAVAQLRKEFFEHA